MLNPKEKAQSIQVGLNTLKQYSKEKPELEELLAEIKYDEIENITIKDSSYEIQNNLIIQNNTITLINGDLRIEGNLIHDVDVNNAILIVFGRLVVNNVYIGDTKIYVDNSVKLKGYFFEPKYENIKVDGKIKVDGFYTTNHDYGKLKSIFGLPPLSYIFFKEELFQKEPNSHGRIQYDALFQILKEGENPLYTPQEFTKVLEKLQEEEEKKTKEKRAAEEEEYAKEFAKPINVFKRQLNDWGYLFSNFAGTDILGVEDSDIIGGGVLTDAGDWVVYDTRGQSGIYGISHEDYSISKIKLKPKVNIDDTLPPINRIVTTPELMKRYMWVSEFFQDWAIYYDNMSPMFYWAKTSLIDEDYQKEKPYLKDDPYLALYWLIHFGLLIDSRYAEVKHLVQDVEHDLVQGALAFFEELKENPHYTIGNKYSYEKKEKLVNIFERRRAYAIWIVYSYEYRAGEEDITQWWNSVTVYPKADQYLIRRVRWLGNNLTKFNKWQEFDALLKNEKNVAYLLKGYIQSLHPNTKDKAASAHQFLQELKIHKDIWNDKLSKQFAAVMVHEIYHFVEDKGLLKEILDIFFEDTLSENYNEIIKYIGIEGLDKEIQAKISYIIKQIQKTPEQITKILSKEDEKIQQEVIQNLLNKSSNITQQVFYYLLDSHLPATQKLLTKLVYQKYNAVPNLWYDKPKYAHAIQSTLNHKHKNIIMLLTANPEGVEQEDLEEAKEKLSKFLVKIVHKNEIFAFVLDSLRHSQDIHLKIYLIRETLFENYRYTTANKLNKKQVNQLLETLLNLYTNSGSQPLTLDNVNDEDNELKLHLDDTLTSSISSCKSKYAFDWLKQNLDQLIDNKNKSKKTKELREAIIQALRNLKKFDILVNYMFEGEMTYNSRSAIMDFIQDQTNHQTNHTKILQRIKKEQNNIAASCYMAVLEQTGDNLMQFELSYMIYEIIKNSELNISPKDLPKIKYLLLRGVEAGIYSGKTKNIQNMFDTAMELTDQAPVKRGQDKWYESDLEYIFDEGKKAKKALQKLQKGEFKDESSIKHKNTTKIPFNKIKDKQIAKAYEFKIKTRIWNNPETSEILYLDSNYKLHYFDGINITTPPFKIFHLQKDQTDFFTSQDLRTNTIMYVNPKKEVAEIVRYGDKKIAYYLSAFKNGRYNDIFDSLYFDLSWGFEFDTTMQADQFFAVAKDNFPLKIKQSSPWYTDNYGVISRKIDNSKLNYLGFEGWDTLPPFYEEPTKHETERFIKKENELLIKGKYLHQYEFETGIHPKELTSLNKFLSDIYTTKSCKYWNSPLDFYDYLDEWYTVVQNLQQSHLFDGLKNIKLEALPTEETEKYINQLKAIAEIPKELEALWLYKRPLKILHKNMRLASIFYPKFIVENIDSIKIKNAEYMKKYFTEEREEKALEMLKGAIPIARKKAGNGGVYDYLYTPSINSYIEFPTFDKLALIDILKKPLREIKGEERILDFLNMGDKISTHNETTYLELKDKKSDKFYRLIADYDNLALFSEYGKIGSEAKISRKDFDDLKSLKKTYEKQVQTKIAKGYVQP